MKKIYFVNNYSGIFDSGIENSVYALKESFSYEKIIEEKDLPDINVSKPLKKLERVIDINEGVYEFQNEILQNMDTPILIGGDHSIAIGSVKGSLNNFDDLALVWIDAHADINTEYTTPSGNIHGMPVARILQLAYERLSNIGNMKRKLNPRNLIYLGLRDLDPGEEDIIKELNIKAYYFDQIEDMGLKNVLKEVKEYLPSKNIHISFDLDSMNPELSPGVSTPVKEGFSLEESLEMLDFFKLNYNVVAYDFVEYNQSKDIDNKTKNNLISLVKSIYDE